jgi:competence protein ComEA
MRIVSSVLGLICCLPLLAWAGPVDINTADASTLARELRGVGASRAEAIVAYRKQHGPFKSVDELGLVKGIGQRVIDDNRGILVVAKPRAAAPGASAAGKPAPKPAAKTAPQPAR